MKSMRKLGVLGVLSYLISCASFTVPQTEKELGCQEVVQYQISSSFMDHERQDILLAFDAWSEATNGATCFVPGPNGFTISRADDQKTIADLDLEARNRFGLLFILGWAEAGEAWIFPYRINTKPQFFNTAVHEIGHLLGLNHYDGPNNSYMHPSVSPLEEDHKIHQQDKLLICSLHPCR